MLCMVCVCCTWCVCVGVDRPRFETQCSALVGRCVRLIEETLLEAGSTKKDISKVM